MNIYRVFSLAFLIVGCMFGVTAQTNTVLNNPYNQVSIASPTAASLGKYADIPVNYHTGIPQISLPIYTVKAGSLSLPISLSYHASGLKVQEPASWAGAGWALNAGGVITRTVVGAPDERWTGNPSMQSSGHFSDYGYNNYLYSSGQQDWQAFANGWKDGEPDLYFFNFGGYSGKFYFNDDHTPVIVPEQDFKIAPSYTGSGSIQSFIITTPDGVQYYFGNSAGISGDAPIEITTPVTAQNGQSSGTAVSSWYLNKITSADGIFSIKLSYTAENYGYFTVAMFAADGNATGSDAYGYNLVKNVVKGVRLSQITFPNGRVNFIPGSIRTDLSDNAAVMTDGTNQQAARLGAIQITDSSSFCKQYNFNYGYFQDNTNPLNGLGITSMNYNLQTDKLRLRLDSVQEISCDGSVKVPPYKFGYFSEQVPRRLTFGVDHWGLYNGVFNNQTLIPTYTLISTNNNQTVTGANRDAAWPAMRGDTLQKITYPAGGYSLFDFESNNVVTNYSQYSDVNLSSLVIYQYGQSRITHTVPFTVSGNGDCEIAYHNNNLRWSPTITVTNSSNAVLYNSGFIAVSSASKITLQLAPGTYQATLSFPSNFSMSQYPNDPTPNGADATISQWQYVPVSATKTVGGLRIKTITHNDGLTTKDMVTSYTYETNGTSSAVLYSRPVYVAIVRNDLIQKEGYWNPSAGFQPFMTQYGCTTVPNASFYKSPNSIRAMGTTQGYPVGYRQVQVSQTGNGYSIYNYYGNYNGNNPWQGSTEDAAVTTVNTNGCDANAPNYPPAPLPFEFLRGELQHEAHYSESGQLLKDVNYTPVFQNSTVTTPGFIVVARAVGSAVQLLGTKYDLVNARKTQMTTVTTDYTAGAGNIVTTITDYYQSAFHHQSTSRTVVTSTGDNLVTKMNYAQDFRIASCDAIADGWQTYTSDCSTCKSTYDNATGACSTSQCYTTAFLNYQQCLSNARIQYVNYRRTYFTDPANSTDPSNTFIAKHNTAKNNADGELKPILELQDEYKNPVIETSTYKNNNLISASFNRHDYGMNGSLFVYPNRLKTLFPPSLSATFTNAITSSSGTSVTKDSRYIDEAFYKFNKGNPAEVTGKDGVTTSYIWDNTNTLPIVKAVGVDVTTLNNAYAAVSGNLTQLRTQSSLSNAQVSTYTYSQLLGLTGGTDASGKTITYEYDKLGRLIIMRDQNGNVIKKNDYKYVGQ